MMSDLTEPEATFLAMDSEWQSLCPSCSAQPFDSLAWEEEIARLSAEQDKLIMQGRWVVGTDDILSIIGRSRREAYHSAMIAWLLNPLGKHGFGTALLERLLKHCGIEGITLLRQARVELEIQREGTRADILAFGPSFTLVLENKVDAGEQERQCERLYEYFGIEPGAVFLFLTPDGRKPHTAVGASAEAWRTLSYPELARMIEEVVAGLKTPAVACSAVQNYLLTLWREFK